LRRQLADPIDAEVAFAAGPADAANS